MRILQNFNDAKKLSFPDIETAKMRKNMIFINFIERFAVEGLRLKSRENSIQISFGIQFTLIAASCKFIHLHVQHVQQIEIQLKRHDLGKLLEHGKQFSVAFSFKIGETNSALK